VQVVACRPCGRGLIRSYTGRTLLQGWWGAISFFFNWFVLASNAFAWRKLGRIDSPSLSGELVEGVPGGFEEDADATGKGSRLRLVFVVLVGGFMLLGLVAWAWDASHHDHDAGHGRPAPVALVEEAMTRGGSFASEDGLPVKVVAASCIGDGEGSIQGFTHFRCAITFANGEVDDVVVHLLPGDELFFKSSLGDSA
jgi:hypothetical protein